MATKSKVATSLQDVNHRLVAAIRDCEEQLESARKMLRQRRQDNDRQLTD